MVIYASSELSELMLKAVTSNLAKNTTATNSVPDENQCKSSRKKEERGRKKRHRDEDTLRKLIDKEESKTKT